jgi:fructoselysine-6-P-deglycase FrlB-like protein
MVTEIQKHGATVCVVGDSACGVPSERAFLLPMNCPQEIGALHFVCILQSLAYHLALKHNQNPDSPGELVKFIVYNK